MPRRNRFLLKAFLPLGLLAVAVLALVRRGGDDWEYEQAEPVTEEAPGRAPGHPPPARCPLRLRSRIHHAVLRGSLVHRGRRRPDSTPDGRRRRSPRRARRCRGRRRSRRRLSRPHPQKPLRSRPLRSRPFRSRPFRGRVRSGRGQFRSRPSRSCVAEPARGCARRRPVAARRRERRRRGAAAACEQAAPAQAPRATSSLPRPHSRPTPELRPPRARCRQAGEAADADEAVGREARRRGAGRRARDRAASNDHGEPTIWLNRALPDPTPASARLDTLVRQGSRLPSRSATAPTGPLCSACSGRRATGASVPATTAELDTLAARLAGENAWKGALAVSGRTTFADRAARTRRPLQVGRARGARDRPRGREGAADRAAARRRERVDLRRRPRGPRGRTDRRPRRRPARLPDRSGTGR